jgi:hypothetical protein
MNQLKTRTDETDEGWVVQIYDRQRRLICLVDPSHGWAFFLGCVAGFLVTAVGFSRAAQVSQPPLETPQTPVSAPPLQVD